MALSLTTQDHDEIRAWAEKREAKPMVVADTEGKGGPGIIRLAFPNSPYANDDKLKEISWEEYFENFDESHLAMIIQEQTAAGEQSNFNRLIHPENASGSVTPSGKGTSAKKTTKKSSTKAAKKAPAKSPASAKKPAGKPAAKKAPAKASTKKGAPVKGAKTAPAKKSAGANLPGVPGNKAAAKSAATKKSAAKAPAKKGAPAKKAIPAKAASGGANSARKVPAKKAATKKR